MGDIEEVAALLRDTSDVLYGRVDSPAPPPWTVSRGWTDFLLALDDDLVGRAERDGLWSLALAGAPPDLRDLCQRTRRLVTPFDGSEVAELSPFEREHVPLRKRSQVALLVERLGPVVRRFHLDRIVDVGAGHGHFARAARAMLATEVIGIDQDADRISMARRLDASSTVTFDEGTPDSVVFRASDLAFGLHACGSLGDDMLRQASSGRACVLLVSCCLQKIDTDTRQPLSASGQESGLAFPRSLLGLSNLSWGSGAASSMRGRLVRHALRLLLRSRGVVVTSGDTARGVHKRRFRQGLAEVAPLALTHRQLEPASSSEIETYEERGREEFARMRRLSLPRNMLGRLLELALVVDRACFLREHDYEVELFAAFSTDVSPRNLTIVATPQPG